MRFAIFTHVLHQPKAGEFLAYSPYVREMNLWLQQVDEVEVIAPLFANYCKVIGSPYFHRQVFFTRISNFDLLSAKNTFLAILIIPGIFIKILGAMQRADHIHLRCPGNVGLLACICQIFFPHKPKTAKYAGNWDPEAKQPWTYKLQKWILANTFLTRNMTVLVYGNWPDQTKNISPFFTASFTESEIEKKEKNLSLPYKFLFVGNLVSGKQPLRAVKLVDALIRKNIPVELHVYGDGPLKYNLESEAKNKDYIHLHGNKPLEVLKYAYEEAHFLILASKSEGWPKAVAEAMFFGCIPIATGVSCVPWMLGDGSRGILMSAGNVWNENLEDSGLLDTFQKSRQFECFQETADAVSENVSRTGFSETLEVTGKRSLPEPGGAGEDRLDVVEDTVDRIIELINHPEEMKRMSMEAQEWSQEYTLEKFEAAIKEILKSKHQTKK